MKSEEGKSFLREWMKKCGSQKELEDLIYYVYGNKDKAEGYQGDIISSIIKRDKDRPSIKFTVKCFKNIGIYAAVPQKVCRESGKCELYKKNLIWMQDHPNESFHETLMGKDIPIYWFRGEEGVKKFINTYLLGESSCVAE